MKLSGIVLTKNEAKNIFECLRRLKFCDEIIVVDDNSIDQTTKIARDFNARVYLRNMNQDYSSQTNFGMSKAKGEWILIIDADERVSPKLRDEIVKSIKDPKDNTAFYFRRIDYMWGRMLTHGESGNSNVLRLIKKGSGKWKRRVHPYFDFKGGTKILTNPLFHYPHPTLDKFVNSINRWSNWHAKANSEEGKKSSITKIIFYPLAHFVKNYFFKRGFWDGTQGFVYAALMSFHSFLAWSSLWVLQNKSQSGK